MAQYSSLDLNLLGYEKQLWKVNMISVILNF